MIQWMLFLMLASFSCNAMNIEDSDSECSSDDTDTENSFIWSDESESNVKSALSSNGLLNDFLNNTELGSEIEQTAEVAQYNHTVLNSLSTHRREMCSLIVRSNILEEKQKNSDAVIETLATNLNRLAIKVKEHDTKINTAAQLKKRSTREIFSPSRTVDEKHIKLSARNNLRRSGIATVVDTIHPDGTTTTEIIPARDTSRDDGGILYSPGLQNLKHELENIYRHSVKIYCNEIKKDSRTEMWHHSTMDQFASLCDRIRSGEFADSNDMIALKDYLLVSTNSDIFRASDDATQSKPHIFKTFKKWIHDHALQYPATVINTSNQCDFMVERRKVQTHFATNPEHRYISALSINSPVQKQLREELGQLYISYQRNNVPNKYADEFYSKKQQLLYDISQGNFRDSSQEMEELTLVCSTISNLLYQWAHDPDSVEGKNLFNRYKAQCELPIYQRWFGYYEENMLNQGRQITDTPDIWNTESSTCCKVTTYAATSVGPACVYYAILSLFGNC